MESGERIRRVMHVFDEVCDLPPEQRSAEIARLCGDDRELIERVERMLEAESADTALIQTAEAGAGAELVLGDMPPSGTDSRLPDQIASYKIIRELGRGGMGVVYEAEQQNPRRRVALKIIKQTFESSQLLSRFRREAHVLGQLRHPGIAQIIEAGTTTIGHSDIPFYSMELIDGERLDKYAEKLELRDRVELMARVCDAVQHAHQRGIIHRDLKPANIIVVQHETGTGLDEASTTRTTIDDIGQPKILDFGIARMTDADVQVTTIQTHAGQIIGTLGYMSPEQVAGDTEALDTRCDVYALGVLLYQLLAGQLPLELHGKPIVEAARLIREVEPRRLSSLDHSLRGDLDTIVGKAVEKDPAQRYASAAALAEDLRRYLVHAPITAHPPSAMYQLRKFTSRNRALVGGIATTLVMLVLGVIGTSVGLASALQANRDLQQSNVDLELVNKKLARTNDDLKAVSDFQAQQLGRIDVPAMGQGIQDELLRATAEARRDQLKEMIDEVNFTDLARVSLDQNIFEQSLRTVDEQFADQPLVQAKLLVSLGIALRELGLHERAKTPLQQAFDLCKEHRGERHHETASAIFEFGILLHEMGEHDSAHEKYQQAMNTIAGDEFEDQALVLTIKTYIAKIFSLQGKDNEALELNKAVADGRERLLGKDHKDTLSIRAELATNYLKIGKLEESLQAFREVHETQSESIGPLHQETLTTLSYVAAVLYQMDRADEAVDVGRQALEGRRKTHGDDHPYTQISVGNVAAFLVAAGRISEAGPLYREALDTNQRINGPDHPSTVTAMHNLGYFHARQGEYEEANEYYQLVYEADVRAGGEDSYPGMHTKGNIGQNLIRQQKFEEAETVLGELLEQRTRVLGETHKDTLWSQKTLARCYYRWGKTKEAESIITPALAAYREHMGVDFPHTIDAMDLLAEVHMKLDRPTEAIGLYHEIHELRRQSLGEDHAKTRKARENLDKAKQQVKQKSPNAGAESGNET